MTAVFCHNASDRTAETREEQPTPFSRLEFAVSDAAKGIAAAVARLAEVRHDEPAAASLEHGLDVFHPAQEAHRILARHWRKAEAAWEQAEAADVKVEQAKRQGIDARGCVQTARAPGRQATASFEQVERLDAARGRASAALELFDPDGRLNDRAHTTAAIAAAIGDLTGPDWTKARNFLEDPRSLAFLDRMHRRLEEAEPRREWREAMAWRWWLRHRRPTPSGPLTALEQTIGRNSLLTEEEQASYDRVGAV